MWEKGWNCGPALVYVDGTWFSNDIRLHGFRMGIGKAIVGLPAGRCEVADTAESGLNSTTNADIYSMTQGEDLEPSVRV